MSRVYAVMGWPVAHSRSPAMHNAALAALGLDDVYVGLAVPPARLSHAVEAATALGVAGFNVTLPHKTAIMPLLAEIEPAARAIGAVNTVVRVGERWLGANTDAGGLLRALGEAGVDPRACTAVVLGAGGAARAAVVALSAGGAARITIAARRIAAARTVAAELCEHCAPTQLEAADLGATLAAALAHAGLLIQATSASLGAEARQFAAAIPLHALPADAVVCDLVYKPLQTELLRRASERSLRCVDGLGMLLHQGALAFQRWTGEPAPVAVMRAALGSFG
jgi:shikimate dehydrogenase